MWKIPSESEKRKYSRKDIKHVTAIWWTITILVAAIIIWRSTFNLRGLSVYTGVWLAISLACYYFSQRWTYNHRLGEPPNILEIPVYISFTMMVLIALFGAAPYFDDSLLLRQLSSVDELPLGLVLSGVGLVSMWLGYGAIVRLWPHNSVSNSTKNNIRKAWISLSPPSLVRVMLFYSIIVIFRLSLFYAGWGERFGKTIDFGVWNQWLAYPLQLRWFFIALVTLQVLKKRWPSSVAYIVIVFETLFAVVSGWASSLLKIVFVVIGCILFAKRKMLVRSLILGGIILMFSLIILTPVARFYRTVENSSILNSLTALSEGFDLYSSSRESLIYTSNLLVRRQTATAQTPSLFLKFTPTYVPYRPIDELLLAPFSVIPRVMWPTKPEYGRLGGIITQDYFRIFRLDAGSSASTFAGSAYIYGGWWVVIGSMFALGVVSALLYALIALPAIKEDKVGLLALYIGVVITNFHIGEGDVLGLWQGIFQASIVFYVFLIFMCFRTGDKMKRKIQT